MTIPNDFDGAKAYYEAALSNVEDSSLSSKLAGMQSCGLIANTQAINALLERITRSNADNKLDRDLVLQILASQWASEHLPAKSKWETGAPLAVSFIGICMTFMLGYLQYRVQRTLADVQRNLANIQRDQADTLKAFNMAQVAIQERSEHVSAAKTTSEVTERVLVHLSGKDATSSRERMVAIAYAEDNTCKGLNVGALAKAIYIAAVNDEDPGVRAMATETLRRISVDGCPSAAVLLDKAASEDEKRHAKTIAAEQQHAKDIATKAIKAISLNACTRSGESASVKCQAQCSDAGKEIRFHDLSNQIKGTADTEAACQSAALARCRLIENDLCKYSYSR